MNTKSSIAALLVLLQLSTSFAFFAQLTAPWKHSRLPLVLRRGCSQRFVSSNLRPWLHRRASPLKTELMMSGAGDKAFHINQQELELAEQQLEDAVASNDVNAINKAIAKLEKIQGPLAGKKAFDKSSIDKAKETDLINSMLGKSTDAPVEAAEDLADTIAQAEAAHEQTEIDALEKYLEDSIISHDAEGAEIAISKLRALIQETDQETATTGESKDEAADAVASALEKASIEEGHDFDVLEILGESGDMQLRSRTLQNVIDEAVRSNDSKLLEKALRTLEKLMGEQAGKQKVSGPGVDSSQVKELLAKIGIDDVQLAQAAQEISEAIAQIEGEESEGGMDEDEDVWSSVKEIQDKSLQAATVERLLDEAVEIGDEDLMSDSLLSLRFVESSALEDRNKNLENVLRALKELTGREVTQQEAFDFATAIQKAHESTESEGADLFDKVRDKKLAIEWTLSSLDEFVRSNDAKGIQESVDQLNQLEYSSAREERDFKQQILNTMAELGMEFKAPTDVTQRRWRKLRV
eukprot:767645-Hanusia_phi.AAC.6